MDLSNDEKDLILLIRDYRSAYPNGKDMLEKEILGIVYDLMGH